MKLMVTLQAKSIWVEKIIKDLRKGWFLIMWEDYKKAKIPLDRELDELKLRIVRLNETVTGVNGINRP